MSTQEMAAPLTGPMGRAEPAVRNPVVGPDALAGSRLRSLGAEEELFLVSSHDGRASSQAAFVVARVAAICPRDRDDVAPGGAVVHEMAKQQIEVNSRPHQNLGDLGSELRYWRGRAAQAAAEVGAAIVASGTYPGQVRCDVVPDARYEAMLRNFGITAREHLTSGFHVHVEVDSREEAVGVVDRIRVWLPVLLALSANSPFWNGEDTGFASYRYPAMDRWPSAGPTDVFGSAAAYDALVDGMVASGVLLDRAMVYFDVRICERYPTVEIRIADACLSVEDAVLVAGLCRALVHTAAEEWAAGEPAPAVPTAMLKLASWGAAHDGTDGELLHPLTGRPLPAWDVVRELVDHVRPALLAYGDLRLVESGVATVRARGTGARRQREAYGRAGDPRDVVAVLVAETLV